jgi:hypothetical protein
MYNLKVAQFGGMASNPANGINNIMLQGGQDQQQVPQQPNMMNQIPQQGMNANPMGGEQTGGMGIDAETVLQELKGLQSLSPEQLKLKGDKIMELSQQAQSEEYRQAIEVVANLCMHNSDPNKQTIDPVSGEKEPLAQDKIRELIQRIEGDMREDKKNVAPNTNASNSAFNLNKYAAPKSVKDEGDGKKKKTRGNPFRVLMGQVGKLLDHGMGKRDIVKHLLKKKYWESETIEKAIDIVKDYNRKKHQKDRVEKKASISTFNLRKAEKVENEKDYNIKPVWAKRSTVELFARAQWLKSAQAFNDSPQNDGRKAADLNGVSSELKSIRTALKERGFKEEEMP